MNLIDRSFLFRLVQVWSILKLFTHNNTMAYVYAGRVVYYIFIQCVCALFVTICSYVIILCLYNIYAGFLFNCDCCYNISMHRWMAFVIWRFLLIIVILNFILISYKCCTHQSPVTTLFYRFKLTEILPSKMRATVHDG